MCDHAWGKEVLKEIISNITFSNAVFKIPQKKYEILFCNKRMKHNYKTKNMKEKNMKKLIIIWKGQL